MLDVNSQDNRSYVTSSNPHDSAKAVIVGKLTDELSTLAEAQQLTRRLARSHYENFLVASLLLPRPLRQPFYDVYAYCRIADDVADESQSRDAATEGLVELRQHVEACWNNCPTNNLFLALRKTVQNYSLDQQAFLDLLDAFEQDQHQLRYHSDDELIDYCRRSANPVGRIVLQLAGCLNGETAALSDSICTGLQLANHWQDIARDYAIGRIYLPQSGWEQFGVDETMFTAPDTPLPLRRAISHQCDVAEKHLRDGLALADKVPSWLASDIRLFAHGGLQTIAAIREIDFDVLRVRPTVSKWCQAKLMVKALLRRL